MHPPPPHEPGGDQCVHEGRNIRRFYTAVLGKIPGRTPGLAEANDNTSKERDSASRTRKAGLSASAQMTAALGWAARDRREDLPSAGGGWGIHPTHIVGADKGGECQGCAR
jgi:hypothetical protein